MRFVITAFNSGFNFLLMEAKNHSCFYFKSQRFTYFNTFW